MAEPKVSILLQARDAVSRVVDGIRGKLTGLATSVRSAFSGINGILAGIGIAASGAAVADLFQRAIAEASDAEDATLRVRDAVDRLGLSYDALAPKIDDYVNAAADAAALDNDEVAKALAILVTRSRDLTGSLNALNIVTGVARKERMDLAAAADLVGRAVAGETRGLRGLGIITKDADEAMARLRATYEGFANDDVGTFERAQRRIENGWNAVLEKLGQVILTSPTVKGWMDRLGQSLEDVAGDATYLEETVDTVSSTLQVFADVITIAFRSVVAVAATVALPIAAAVRGIGAAFAALHVLVGQAVNGIIGGMNAIRRATALPGQKVNLIPLVDLTAATKLRDEWARQAVTDVKEIGNAWKATGEAVGEAFANASLADERARARREGRPVTGTAGGRRTGGELPPPRRPTGTGEDEGETTAEDKQKKADDARAREIAGLAEIVRLRTLTTAETERLGTLQRELAAEIAKESAAIEAGHGSTARLAALEKARAQGLQEITRTLDAQRAQQAQTLLELLELRRLDGAGLSALLTIQQQVTAAVAEEAARVREGVGDRERLLALLKQQQALEDALGKPQTVTDGVNAPRPADRLEAPRVRHPELEPPDDALPEWLERVAQGYERIVDTQQRASDGAGTFSENVQQVAGGALGAFQNAANAAFENIGNGTRAMGRAFANAIRAGIADAAKAKGQYYFNLGVAAIGEGLFGNFGAFAAAAKFFAASAGFFALGNLAGGGAGAGGGGGGGGGAGGNARGGLDGFGRDRAGNPVTLVLPNGPFVFDPTDPRTVEAWRLMMEDLTDRQVFVVTRG